MLYPLFLQSYRNLPFHPWLRGSLEGIGPEQCRNLLTWRDRFRPGVFSHVVLHAQMQSRHAQSTRDVTADLRAAGFSKRLIQANVAGLTRIVAGLEWKQARSTWSDYVTSNTYSAADREQKEAFVRAAVRAQPRRLVWDLGANTGHFARIAAEDSDYVVAMDSDHLAIEHLYRSLNAAQSRKILPLLNNLVDASPNLGWRGKERSGLAERGRPDLALCLALIHHIVIGANVPLREFIDWLASLGCDLVIEFVTKDDPMVRTLLRNKRDDYADYSPEFFERCLSDSFQLVRRATIQSGTRTLYYAVAKAERLT